MKKLNLVKLESLKLSNNQSKKVKGGADVSEVKSGWHCKPKTCTAYHCVVNG